MVDSIACGGWSRTRDSSRWPSPGALAFAEAKDFEIPDDADRDGNYRLTVVVSDGQRSDTEDLTVALANVNEAPTADAGPDQVGVRAGATVTLRGSASDPDSGDTPGYAWWQAGPAGGTFVRQGHATARFAAPDGLTRDTTFTFTLRVTDTGGLVS